MDNLRLFELDPIWRQVAEKPTEVVCAKIDLGGKGSSDTRLSVMYMMYGDVILPSRYTVV